MSDKKIKPQTKGLPHILEEELRRPEISKISSLKKQINLLRIIDNENCQVLLKIKVKNLLYIEKLKTVYLNKRTNIIYNENKFNIDL